MQEGRGQRRGRRTPRTPCRVTAAFLRGLPVRFASSVWCLAFGQDGTIRPRLCKSRAARVGKAGGADVEGRFWTRVSSTDSPRQTIPARRFGSETSSATSSRKTRAHSTPGAARRLHGRVRAGHCAVPDPAGAGQQLQPGGSGRRSDLPSARSRTAGRHRGGLTNRCIPHAGKGGKGNGGTDVGHGTQVAARIKESANPGVSPFALSLICAAVSGQVGRLQR